MKVTEESRKKMGQSMTGAEYKAARLDARLTHHDLGVSRVTLWRIEQSDSVALRHVLALHAMCNARANVTLKARLDSLGL